MQSARYGAVAAGHNVTADAAIQMLESGGNAFDAIVAATAAACVCEPVLASLGGGGFMTARNANGKTAVYDFFVQTPANPKRLDESDFYPTTVDFGSTQQEFHIGNGSIATPGVVKGLFAINNELGTMPMREILEPSVMAARNGVEINSLQSYLYSIVSPILLASHDARLLFSGESGEILKQGEFQYFGEMADLFETLAIEGEDLFYRGEVASAIARQCESGGHLQREDLQNYHIKRRTPHCVRYGNYEMVTNPAPSSGGILIGFALQLIEGKLKGHRFGSSEHLSLLATTIEQTNKGRLDAELQGMPLAEYVKGLDKEAIESYKQYVVGRPQAMRGTTHICVVDTKGNQASLTLSNGEGCGSTVPGCGFMLNNMLGEEDLNPKGFGRWLNNTRMTSMMAPSLLRDYKRERDWVLGSGGSNRIRSAIVQVLLNIMEFDMDVQTAVDSPRIHIENDDLNIEGGIDPLVCAELKNHWPKTKAWDERNLYFGGVHTVLSQDGHFDGAGDARRGGTYRVC